MLSEKAFNPNKEEQLNQGNSTPVKSLLASKSMQSKLKLVKSDNKIDEELEDCVKNMKNPVFGYPLMDFSQVDFHQIPQEFLMFFNQEILEREYASKKGAIPSEKEKPLQGMAFISEKVLNSKQKNFKDMVECYINQESMF